MTKRDGRSVAQWEGADGGCCTNTWEAGPDFPGNINIADVPAALEVNGQVLMMASPGYGNPPVTFFEWDGKALKEVAETPNAPPDGSF